MSVVTNPPDLPLLKPWPRVRAWLNMLFVDHSLFRFVYNTRTTVTPLLHRSGHPMPYQLRQAQAAGVQAVLSLRGAETHVGSNQLEWDTCKRIGLKLVHFPLGSRSEPSREQVLKIIDLLETLPKPLLVHCKSGADRAGLTSAIHLILQGESYEVATKQLDFWRHGHIRQAKTGVLDHFLDAWRAWELAHPGVTFRDWVANHYDAAAVKASFHSGFWANQLVDRILRRE
ncbi:MAG: tyrosine-protein phosphatase [Nevskia sp.]